jgi:hypothetical protein
MLITDQVAIAPCTDCVQECFGPWRDSQLVFAVNCSEFVVSSGITRGKSSMSLKGALR